MKLEPKREFPFMGSPCIILGSSLTIILRFKVFSSCKNCLLNITLLSSSAPDSSSFQCCYQPDAASCNKYENYQLEQESQKWTAVAQVILCCHKTSTWSLLLPI